MNINPTKLSDTNWSTWRTEIELFASTQKCETELNKQYTAEPSGDEKIRMDTARLIIIRGLDEQHRLYINDIKYPKEMIEALESVQNKQSNEYNLEKELVHFTWKPAESVEYFVNRLTNLMSRFKKANQSGQASDTKFILKMLELMPKSMNALKGHIELKFALGETVSYKDACKWLVAAWNNLNNEQTMSGYKGSDQAVQLQQQIKSEDQTFMASQSWSKKWCRIHRSKTHDTSECRANRYNHVHDQQRNAQGPNSGSRADEHTTRASAGGSAFARSSTGANARGWNYVNNPNESSSGSRPQSGDSAAMVIPNFEYDDTTFMAFESPQLAITRESNERIEAAKSKFDQTKMFLDDGASRHIVNDLSLFAEYERFEREAPILSVNGGSALGRGTVKVISRIAGVDYHLTLANVLYIPGAPCNLLSELALQDAGADLEFRRERDYVYIEYRARGKILIEGKRRVGDRSLFATTVRFVANDSCMLTMNEWHDVLHISDKRLVSTAKVVDGMQIDGPYQECGVNCVTCIQSKAKRRPFKGTLIQSTTPGEVLHSDIAKLPVQSIGRKRAEHAVFFIDEATRFKRVYFLSDLTGESLREAIQMCFCDQNSDIGTVPRRLHSDRGTNYESRVVQEYLLGKETKWTSSTAENKESNGLAENTVQHIVNMTTALLLRAKCPKRCWGPAMNYAVYLSNRVMNSTTKRTPFEAYLGRKPDLAHLKRFGRPVEVHIPKKSRKKFSPKTIEMKFAGFKDCKSNCFVMDTKHTYVTTATSVYFIEERGEQTHASDGLDDQGECILQPLESSELENGVEQSGQMNIPQAEDLSLISEERVQRSQTSGDGLDELDFTDGQSESSTFSEPQAEQAVSACDQEVPIGQLPVLTDEQTAHFVEQPVDHIFEFDILVKDVKIPKSTADIEGNAHAEHWLDAMDRHYLSLIGADTWELVPREEAGAEDVLTGYFIYSVKSSDNVHVDRFKARFVIDGSDVENTADYSPVIHPENLRIMLAAAVQRGWHIHTVDVEDAYLHSPIEKNVYMYQPAVYVCPDKPKHVCKLKKSLFGLPDSGFNWYKTFLNYLIENNFQQSKLDPCILFSSNRDLFVLLYVDDSAIISPSLDLIRAFKEFIGKRFKYRDQGQITSFLGVEFRYDREKRELFMNNKAKILKLVEEFKKYLPQQTKVPLDSTTYICRPSPSLGPVSVFLHIAGCILFIATRTRPELLGYIICLSRFMKCPTVSQMFLLLKIVAYLAHTANYEFVYKANGDEVVAYADSSFGARECFDGRPRTGTIVKFAGMTVTWCSRRQSIIADENCLAELYAMNMGLKAGLAVRNLLRELGLIENKPFRLKGDNKSAMAIAEGATTKYSKHYHLILLNVRDHLRRKQVLMEYVKSTENTADLYTKFVINSLFYQFRDDLGVVNTNVRKSLRK